ncbi:unnamed protein product [Rotaria sp. Silwood1]|nr:unnamed protein product [Rotaria sp. Silwood1]
MFNTGDSCGSAVRCNKAAAANASGCLLYNVGPIAGSSFIPSGSISLADGQRIAAITTQNPSAVFTFTNLVNLLSTVTLFLAQIGNPAPETVGFTSRCANCRPSFSEVVNIFQSNAKPVNIYNTSMLSTTIEQGAGLVNAFQALTATTIISPSELALNDTVRRQKFYKIKVYNNGNKPVRYSIGHRGAAMATPKQPGDDQLLLIPKYTADYAVSYV